MPGMKWTGPIFFFLRTGNRIFGQILAHQRVENEARNTKMNSGQGIHPISVNARDEMNWANSFFSKSSGNHVYRQTSVLHIWYKYQVKLDASHSAPTYLCSHLLAVIFLGRKFLSIPVDFIHYSIFWKYPWSSNIAIDLPIIELSSNKTVDLPTQQLIFQWYLIFQ